MPPFDTQKHSVAQSLNWFTDNAITGAHALLAKSMPATVEEVDKTGTIATIKIEVQQPVLTFPSLVVPVYGPEYLRWPLKKGDKGVFFSADFSLGDMSGLGEGGVAKLALMPNLSTGVFFPIGNTKFSEREDGEGEKVLIYGPEGVTLKTEAGDEGRVEVGTDNVRLVFDDEDKIVAEKEGVTIYATGSITGNYLEMSGEGFKFYVNGGLKFIIDGAGARYVGNAIPGAGGATYGINTTDTGTHIDNVNFLPHKHKDTQPGTGDTGVINIITSPALAANDDEGTP